MRLAEIAATRAERWQYAEPLSAERRSRDNLRFFRLAGRPSLKRSLSDAVAPLALAAAQPLIRRELGITLPYTVDCLAWGDRFSGGTSFRAVERRVGLPSSVLVQGCSFGDAAVQSWLRKGVERVAGIELFDMTDCWAETVPRLEATYGRSVDLRHGTLESMPFDDGSFDLITSAAVYEHVYRLPLAAAEAARVLAPGGWAYHTIGPLYYSCGGDHCGPSFDHLLLTESDYRNQLADNSRYANLTDPNCRYWALADKFSFATATDYLAAFEPYFTVEYLLAIVSPEAAAFRDRQPERWLALLAAGVPAHDLLIKSLHILVRKR